MQRTQTARIRIVAWITAAFALSGGAVTAQEAPAGSESTPRLAGHVAAEALPVPSVTVYAYDLSELTTSKTSTDRDGQFDFDALPAGIYKLIAFKAGFEPAVVLLSRAARDMSQFVEIALQQQETLDVREGETFWSMRSDIPSDVLRDIQETQLAALLELPAGRQGLRPFRGAVQATAGMDEVAGEASQLAGAQLGMEGHIGSVALDLSGEYWLLEDSQIQPADARTGEATNLALQMQGAGRGRVDMTTINQTGPAAGASESDFERYRVSWSQPIGERMESSFGAQYLQQVNFFRQSQLAPIDVPAASRILDVHGAYSMDIASSGSLRTGIRFQQEESLFSPVAGDDYLRSLELYGSGGWRIQPSVLVEYGLVSRLEDGSYALAPQGTVVVQLGETWQAIGTASQRVDEGDPRGAFTPMRHTNAGSNCQGLDEYCYRVMLAHQGPEDRSISVGAVHRELAETLQLYFNDDFFNQMETLYLVQGDELPEIQLALQRRVTPQILARLESNYADGGGGVLYATDHNPYENKVRYLVTSLDTHFQRSSTGVFLAFHHLEQELLPLGAGTVVETPTETNRLQLMLSQDLNVLRAMAAEWSLHLNMEVSQGALPFSLVDPADEEELRRRVTGGVSVRF